MRSRFFWALVLFLLPLVFLTNQSSKVNSNRKSVEPELLVSLPLLPQLLLAAGDRHLAANLNSFRVLVSASDRMREGDYMIQARLQHQAAILNPRHEDNYYIAEAVLPWNGHLETAQDIIRKSAVARPFDWLPSFYLAFHQYYFYRDPPGGAKLLLGMLPSIKDQNDIWAAQNLAAKWVELGYSPRLASSIVDAMAEQSQDGGFKRYLRTRAERLKTLAMLNDQVRKYRELYGKFPAGLDDLLTKRLIDIIPIDPFGMRFTINANGEVAFAKPEQ